MADRFEHKAGTIVYEQMTHDYGLARDDTRATGIRHVSVTTKPDGGYPGFTVPAEHLIPMDSHEPVDAKPEPTIADLRLQEAEHRARLLLAAKDNWRALAVTRSAEVQAMRLQLDVVTDMLREASDIVANAAAMDSQHEELAARIQAFLSPSPVN